MKKNKKQQVEKSTSEKARSNAKKGAIVPKNLIMLLIGICVVLTAIAYMPAMKGEFVNMDDNDYASANEMIRSFSNLKKLITTPVQGNYHPLTMISLAVNYSISGLDTGSYHLLNLLLHLCNTALVFWFMWVLSGRSLIAAFTTAMIFGVHPMHVESVAWITERKDVLYTFFFMLGLISYLQYIDSNSKSRLAWTLIFFILSITSKPAAIIFPLALLTIDMFRSRQWNASLITEKIPFVVISGIMALLTLNAQSAGGATDVTNSFSLANRFFFGFYGFMMYIVKFVLPINLAVFYPLPPFHESLGIEYYLAPIFFAVVAGACWITRKTYPIILWGVMFFTVTVILVLQFKVIGSAIMADRYSYVPFIGLAAIVGWFLDKALRDKQTLAFSVITGLGLVLTSLTYMQASTWQSSATLWENAIAHAPSERAYTNRASTLRSEGKLDQALEYYNKGLSMYNTDHWAYSNRANIYFDKNNDSLALRDYNMALSISPNFAPALANRGALYARRGQNDLALADLNRALSVNPDFSSAYTYRAITYFNMRDYASAIKDYERCIRFEPKDIASKNSLAQCYQNVNRHNEAVAMFSSCISMQPRPAFFFGRAISYSALGNNTAARADAEAAIKGGMQLPPGFLQQIGMR